MPRTARLDVPGVLHHVMIRGIERMKIFRNDKDREDFIGRLETLCPATQTSCYAWAYMSNHAHFLVRTGTTPLSRLMRRLLTGYVIGFNHRHKRRGQLFQNRYESIISQSEEQYDRRYDLKRQGFDLDRIAARELGMSLTELTMKLEMSIVGVGFAVERGDLIAKKRDFMLIS